MLPDSGAEAEIARESVKPVPRVKTVACLSGVSLERGVPTEEIHDYIREAENVVWVDVQDAGPTELAMLVEEFGFHPLALEGAGQGQRRSKVDEYKGYLLLIAYAAVDGPHSAELQTAEVDLFIGRNYVVTLHSGRVPALEEALSRWMRGGSMLREGVDFLVYAVLDATIDSYLPLIERVEDEIGETEISLFAQSDDAGVRNLLRLKRTLIALRRALFPLREIFQILLRRDHPLFLDSAGVFLRDVSDHVLRILDVLDTEREMVAGALEASLTVSSHQLNKTMKTLSVITVAVAVVGSVFAAYGMNFTTLPLAGSEWGFWVISFGTIGLVSATIWIGRWKKLW